MNTVYHLGTCDTCRKILRRIPENTVIEARDIKKNPLTASEIDALAKFAGSYEALFSRRSQQYKTLNPDGRKLDERDYREAILSHYTFMKRPVFVIDDAIFIGNNEETVQKALAEL